MNQNDEYLETLVSNVILCEEELERLKKEREELDGKIDSDLDEEEDDVICGYKSARNIVDDYVKIHYNKLWLVVVSTDKDEHILGYYTTKRKAEEAINSSLTERLRNKYIELGWTERVIEENVDIDGEYHPLNYEYVEFPIPD